MLDLVKAIQFSDSALPVGAFAFSNGLESAIQQEIVTDATSLKAFIEVVLQQTAMMDGIALLAAYRAAKAGDYQQLVDIDNTFYAYRVGVEQQLMLIRMGKKLAELAVQIQASELLQNWVADIKSGHCAGSYPCSQALVFAELGLSEAAAFASHQYGITSMILNAAVRLMRIDHYATQTILFELNKDIAQEYEKVKGKTLDDMCMFSPIFEILNAHHVNAHVHMFMS